ncbi:MAG: DUF3108 domain-containing protein [Chthoniobacter sp.]|nr:DUF3108 domain-containing protein [Chthoniobacter sp.]
MKRKLFIPVQAILLAAALAFGPCHAPAAAEASPSELLEKGIYAEETKGDVDAAITIYQQLIAQAKTTQSLAAQAQFRLAQCYLKKNKTAEANAAFEKLIHDFPEEKDLVTKAREHLPSDLALDPVSWVDGERLQLTLKLEAGLEIGAMETRADLVELDGKKVWRVGRLMSGGGTMVSSVDVAADTFRPLTSRWKHTLLGDVSAVFHANEVELHRVGSAEPQKVELNKTVFDNEECFHLLRRLPLKEGYKTNVTVISTLGGGGLIPLELVVEKKETVEVPAGKFGCYKVLIKPLAQSFWISDDAHRYLVKFEGGGAIGVLATIAQRKPDEELHYRNEKAGIAITAPAGWMVYFRAKDKPAEPDSITLTDPGADADMAVMDFFATDSLKEESQKSSRAWAEVNFKDHTAKELKDAKVRPDSWKDETVSGQSGVSFLIDYTEGEKPRVGYARYVVGPKFSERFLLAAAPDKFDALKAAFDRIIASYKDIH